MSSIINPSDLAKNEVTKTLNEIMPYCTKINIPEIGENDGNNLEQTQLYKFKDPESKQEICCALNLGIHLSFYQIKKQSKKGVRLHPYDPETLRCLKILFKPKMIKYGKYEIAEFNLSKIARTKKNGKYQFDYETIHSEGYFRIWNFVDVESKQKAIEPPPSSTVTITEVQEEKPIQFPETNSVQIDDEIEDETKSKSKKKVKSKSSKKSLKQTEINFKPVEEIPTIKSKDLKDIVLDGCNTKDDVLSKFNILKTEIFYQKGLKHHKLDSNYCGHDHHSIHNIILETANDLHIMCMFSKCEFKQVIFKNKFEFVDDSEDVVVSSQTHQLFGGFEYDDSVNFDELFINNYLIGLINKGLDSIHKETGLDKEINFKKFTGFMATINDHFKQKELDEKEFISYQNDLKLAEQQEEEEIIKTEVIDSSIGMIMDSVWDEIDKKQEESIKTEVVQSSIGMIMDSVWDEIDEKEEESIKIEVVKSSIGMIMDSVWDEIDEKEDEEDEPEVKMETHIKSLTINDCPYGNFEDDLNEDDKILLSRYWYQKMLKIAKKEVDNQDDIKEFMDIMKDQREELFDKKRRFEQEKDDWIKENIKQ